METEKEGNKMELFSEVFGAYYQMVYQLLRLCGQEGLTREKIVRLAGRTGFGETSVYLLPKLLGEDGWPFLEQLFQVVRPPPVAHVLRQRIINPRQGLVGAHDFFPPAFSRIFARSKNT